MWDPDPAMSEYKAEEYVQDQIQNKSRNTFKISARLKYHQNDKR